MLHIISLFFSGLHVAVGEHEDEILHAEGTQEDEEVMVAAIWDEYMVDAAVDPMLLVHKFLELADVVLPSAPAVGGCLYFAIDFFLQSMNVLGAVGRRHLEPLRAVSLFARSLAAASSSSSSVAEKEEEHGGFFSSWVGKIKGALHSKPSPPPQPEQLPTSAFTLLVCADELKNARRLSTFSSFLKISPHVTEGAATESIEKCEKMMRAVAKHNPTGQNVDEKQKAAAAKECGCTLKEINSMLTNFEKMKEARAKLLQMKEKGEELPKTMAEFQKVLNVSSPKRDIPQCQSADVGRNAPCTCGSGKKYKRCCGRGT